MKILRNLILVDANFEVSSKIVLVSDTGKGSKPRGKVLMVGEDAKTVKVGDVVWHNPHAGFPYPLKTEGEEKERMTLLMSDTDVWVIE
jgi:co-chaperonin GroES (HSP10)